MIYNIDAWKYKNISFDLSSINRLGHSQLKLIIPVHPEQGENNGSSFRKSQS
jgi:hypothetical protein